MRRFHQRTNPVGAKLVVAYVERGQAVERRSTAEHASEARAEAARAKVQARDSRERVLGKAALESVEGRRVCQVHLLVGREGRRVQSDR